MTLTNRLNWFSLATLGVVLAGFSFAIYLLASRHLHGQAREQLDATINMLAAAAEIKPSGVEWEPAERRMIVPHWGAQENLVWQINAKDGHIIDGSISRTSPEASDLTYRIAQAFDAGQLAPAEVRWRGTNWLIGGIWLHATDPNAKPKRRPRGGEEFQPALAAVAGISLAPVESDLNRLALALGGISVIIWLVALVLGRAISRRALLPVRKMAESARDMDASDLTHRLPIALTGDELGELGRSFNGLLDRLHESHERQRRFTGDASHQLRTPLTAMLGQVDVALRRERPAGEYREALESVGEQANRLRQIVESLLFLARSDAEAQLPDRTRLDLRQWVVEHLEKWSGHERANDIKIEIEGQEAIAASVHPVMLGEIVNILLDNACKFSPPGKPITIRLRSAAGAAELSVVDQGIGMSHEELNHLFQPFYRTPEARRRGVEGTGLGLAIARRLAQALGGSLTVVSQPNAGSCFTLRLGSINSTSVS
jgi:heavy metal sensor kinase